MKEFKITIADLVNDKYPNLSLGLRDEWADAQLVSVCDIDKRRCIARNIYYQDFALTRDNEGNYIIEEVFSTYDPRGCQMCDRNTIN